MYGIKYNISIGNKKLKTENQVENESFRNEKQYNFSFILIHI